MRQTQSKAETEYAVMLAVLNFHTAILKSPYSHVQVHMLDDVIDVVLTRSSPIPAEERLAQTVEGKTQLRETHEATFKSCQHILTEQIERVVGRRVREMLSTIDPVVGRSSMTITFQAEPSATMRADRPPAQVEAH